MTTLRGPLARRVAGLACLITCGCNHTVEPPLDPRAVPLSPPAVYARWWTMTEACSGLSGAFSHVNWYVVPGSADVSVNGDLVTGYYTAGDNKIVLAGEAIYDGGTVRHEILHALRRRPGHSRADFLEHCGGVVNCSGNCVMDAGPLPPVDPGIARVSSAALTVGVRVVPEHPTAAEDEGVFTIIVTARNPLPYPVLLDIAPGTMQSFSYRLTANIGGFGSAVPIRDPGVTRFAAGETKQQLFDFVLGDTIQGFILSPGLYAITGGYDRNSVTNYGISIGP